MTETTNTPDPVAEAAAKAAADLLKKAAEKPEPKYTDADLEQARKDAVAAAQKKADEKALKDKEAADKKAAEEKGEYKTLAEKETERANKLEAENRTLRLNASLNTHLAEKHKDYIGSAKYILPLIPADTADDDLPKAIEMAAAEFVKDNPRQVAKGNAGAPAPGRITQPPAPKEPDQRRTRPFQSLRSF